MAETTEFDTVFAIEPHGFVEGSDIAYRNGKGFVPVRELGKLPSKTVRIPVDSDDILEIHVDAMKPGTRVLLVGSRDSLPRLRAVERVLKEQGMIVTTRMD